MVTLLYCSYFIGKQYLLVQVHAALYPNVRLLAMSERYIRSVTLTVGVTHPGTNAHNRCLNSDSDLSAI